MQPATIGLDLAKNVLQAHGVGAGGEVVLRRKLRRSELLEFFGQLPPCLIGMESVRQRALLDAGIQGPWARRQADAGGLR